MSNLNRTVLYPGVTSNLHGRVYDHKQLEGSHFTRKYECTHLVYYEFHELIESAIEREKQVKKWNRLWKERMIKRWNERIYLVRLMIWYNNRSDFVIA